MATSKPGGEYLAKPPDACCIAGIIHKGDPRGSVEAIADLDTYVATPPEGRANGNVILYFPDVWGHHLNNFLVMDAFASEGYLVLGVDYFRGDPIWKYRNEDGTTVPGFDFTVWKDKHFSYAYENVPRWIEAVKKSRYTKASTKFACVGYCFGAPFVCDELARETCAVGAFAHPAFLKDHHFTDLKGPLFLSCAEVDNTFPTESRNKAMEILKEQKKAYHLQLFSGVQHGFALRGNPDDPYERWTKEQSLKGIADWFTYWFSQ